MNFARIIYCFYVVIFYLIYIGTVHTRVEITPKASKSPNSTKLLSNTVYVPKALSYKVEG